MKRVGLVSASLIFSFVIVTYGSTCDQPTSPHGSVIIHPSKRGKYQNGEVILFGCKQGFYLKGMPIRTCNGDKWTQTQFQCLGFCPEVRNILNGKVSHVTPQVGKAAIEFRCNNKSFQLIGRTRLECIDGRWNGKLPYCHKLPSCVRLQSPANGTLHGYDNSHSAEAKFTCFTGFDLFGASTLTCNKGVWSSRVPTCKAYCKKMRDPPNGRVFGSRFSHGQVVSFKCKHGYQLGGDRTLRCVNGRWNSSVPQCEVIQCAKPSIPSNSRIIYPRTAQVRYKHGTTLYLACHEGHLLTGSPIMVCNYTTWLKREFRCIATCPSLGPIRSGVITHVTRKGGGEVEIKCHANYTLIGSSRLRCINGKWNDSIPSCKDYTPCGESPVELRARIVGGKNSRRGWWPWQIGLRRLNSRMENVLICGGALISRRWILTAAHCFYHQNFRGVRVLDDLSNKYKVTVGDHHLAPDRKEKSQLDVEVETIFVHQNYADGKFANDIALVKLGDEKEVELGPFVRTLCIPEKDDGDLAIPTKFGIATGWGTTKALKFGEKPKKEKQYSARLQYSAFTIQSNKLCAKKSAEYFFNSTVMFCAGEGTGGNDTCYGDSGGAFVREAKRGEDFRWVATGLVSWAVGCAQKDQYGYYTRVYPFIDWMKKTMEDNS